MTPPATDACEIIVTGPMDNTLSRIAHDLVEARLIACANVLDTAVTSTYRWKGAIEVDNEKRAHFHTRAALADQVVAFVKERHPYDVPNVTVVQLTTGNPAYLDWIREETRDPDTEKQTP
jgi:periplasmic divalent cation tolerance protein